MTDAVTKRAAQAHARGSSARAAELREAALRLEALRPGRRDDAATLAAKLHEAIGLAGEVTRDGLAQLDQRAGTARIGIFVGERPALGGCPRARILVGSEPYTVALEGLRPADLRVGQVLELSGDGSAAVDADPPPPADGELLRVVRTRPSGAAGSPATVELESLGGPEQRRTGTVSGFVDPAALGPGAIVRVKAGFVYEVIEGHTDRETWIARCRFTPRSGAAFDEIVGQDDTVRRLRLKADAFAHPQAYAGCDLAGGNTLLIVGPPGNGKSLAAEALAAELRRALGDSVETYLVRGTEVKSMWVGESAARLAELFEHPQRCFRERGVRTLLVFDEAEGLGRKRSAFDTSGVAHDLLGTLLPRLSGAEICPGLFTLFLTNHAESMDEALLRSGRLGGGNTLRMGRLGVEASVRIVRRLLEPRPELFAGSSLDEIEAAARGPGGELRHRDRREPVGRHQGHAPDERRRGRGRGGRGPRPAARARLRVPPRRSRARRRRAHPGAALPRGAARRHARELRRSRQPRRGARLLRWRSRAPRRDRGPRRDPTPLVGGDPGGLRAAYELTLPRAA
jgi:ATP-dependent 26S proteasome regulatory subunit